MSIAPRHRATIIGSDWALRMTCESLAISSTPTPATTAATQPAIRPRRSTSAPPGPPRSPATSRYAIRPPNTDPLNDTATAVTSHRYTA